MTTSNIILNNEQIRQKLNRIAYQIAEYNLDSERLVILGIADTGYNLAEIIFEDCKSLVQGEVHLGKLKLNKKSPMDTPVETDFEPTLLSDSTVIIVDDVLKSGKTLAFAVKYVLNAPVQRLSAAVLVDRMHPRYPIRPDYVGLTLSTTLEEHISVEIEGEEITAYLV